MINLPPILFCSPAGQRRLAPLERRQLAHGGHPHRAGPHQTASGHVQELFHQRRYTTLNDSLTDCFHQSNTVTFLLIDRVETEVGPVFR